MSKQLSPLLLLLLCVSCTQSQGNSTQIQPVASAPSLTAVLQAQTVEIHNDWNGYSDITPILRHSKLRLEQQKLVGNAHIAVGGYGAGGIRQQQTTKVKIPAAITTKFLTALSKTPLQRGTYKPRIDRTDDYPSVRIQIKLNKQEIIFRSESQGIDRVPWKVTVKTGTTTKEYITNSPLPAQALRMLSPTLDRPSIEQIIQRRLQRRK
jgi:hypothetical protein